MTKGYFFIDYPFLSERFQQESMGRENASSESSPIPGVLRTQRLPAAPPLVNKLFLQLLQRYIYLVARKHNWCDCDEATNYMQLTFDNFSGHPYQLSGLNSDYAGRLGWVTELVSL
jgi:hypothetical protein